MAKVIKAISKQQVISKKNATALIINYIYNIFNAVAFSLYGTSFWKTGVFRRHVRRWPKS